MALGHKPLVADINDAELLRAHREADGAIHLISREGEEEEIFRGGKGLNSGNAYRVSPENQARDLT